MMERKTIGILTHWIIPNYGAFMQAYALRNVLDDLFPDHKVFQIAYMNNTHSKMYYGLEMHELYKTWPVNISFYRDVIRRIKRKKEIQSTREFKNYYLNMIPHSDEYNNRTLLGKYYDNLVLGSDILWDYSVDFFGQDKFVFGIGINCKNKISYAASFGSVKKESNHPQYVKDGIRSLNAISVRDKGSSIIISDITSCIPEIHADPTLIWNFRDDKRVKCLSIDCPYVVVYGGDYTEDQIKNIIDYCRRNKYKIIHLHSSGDRRLLWCDSIIEEAKMDPFEWCGYIKNAKTIITGAFHGLMFGLIYEKRIIFNPTDFMISKAEWIIDYLGLNTLIEDKTFKQQIQYEWNYEEINAKLDILRKKSIAYLKNNIV